MSSEKFPLPKALDQPPAPCGHSGPLSAEASKVKEMLDSYSSNYPTDRDQNSYVIRVVDGELRVYFPDEHMQHVHMSLKEQIEGS